MKIKYKSMTFEEMYSKIQNEDLKDYIILDVRMEQEYKERRIPNSILIPDYFIEKVLNKIPNKNTIIFVYCRSGARSKKSTLKLNEMGYINVYDLGGIIYYNGATISN